MASAASRSCAKTSRRSMRRSPTCMKLRSPLPLGGGVGGEGAQLSGGKPSPNPFPAGEGERPRVPYLTAELLAGRGDMLPVSAFPVDGTYPVGTAQWEKRNIAQEVPVWETDLCIE